MIPIICTHSAHTETADAYAKRFNLTQAQTLPENGLYLAWDGHRVSLCKIGEKGQVCVDFVDGAAHYRRTKGGGELIARAVNHTASPNVWDFTGGLGRDSFVLASLGLNITVWERHPVVACLLADGLARAAANEETAEIAARITLIHHDALTHAATYAIEQQRLPETVYLDPMYPERRKSAAVKKEMGYFHELVGSNPDNDLPLLETARRLAKKRIVVKRPRLGECLGGEKPAYQYQGKSTRFDVYLPKNLSADH